MNTANNPGISADRLNAPVYLVIGAYGGVGSDLAMRLSNRSARIIVAGRDIEALELLANSVDVNFLKCDVSDFSQVKECVENARALYGRLDGVANCAGSILLKPAHLTTEAEWDSLIAVNLTAAFAVIKHASKQMMGAGGSIVLVSSCAARVGLPNHEAIAAAKAGVEGLVRSAAATYARHQIRVNCVAPGLLKTRMTNQITANETQLQASKDMHPLGRIGTAADVSVVMDWLLGEESTWITGQSIAIDGGLSSVRSMRAYRQAANDDKVTAR